MEPRMDTNQWFTKLTRQDYRIDDMDDAVGAMNISCGNGRVVNLDLAILRMVAAMPKPDKPNKRTFAYFLATTSLSSIGTLGIALSCKSRAARRSSIG